jgi:acyl-coenzyme A thioesterase PaaI-like protein
MWKRLPRTRNCFVCGAENPAGLDLEFQTDGRVVRGVWTPSAHLAGFLHTVHGGLTATVLDEVMTWACGVVGGRFCYCAEMSVRYLAPVTPGEAHVLEARLTANRRGRIFTAEGVVRGPDGERRAAATGKYLPIPEERLTAMLEDFLGDPAEVMAPVTEAGVGTKPA